MHVRSRGTALSAASAASPLGSSTTTAHRLGERPRRRSPRAGSLTLLHRAGNGDVPAGPARGSIPARACPAAARRRRGACGRPAARARAEPERAKGSRRSRPTAGARARPARWARRRPCESLAGGRPRRGRGDGRRAAEAAAQPRAAFDEAILRALRAQLGRDSQRACAVVGHHSEVGEEEWAVLQREPALQLDLVVERAPPRAGRPATRRPVRRSWRLYAGRVTFEPAGAGVSASCTYAGPRQAPIAVISDSSPASARARSDRAPSRA